MCVFCFYYRDEDWDGAFNFSKDSRFISNCAKKMAGTCHLCLKNYYVGRGPNSNVISLIDKREKKKKKARTFFASFLHL